jgi:hypothetical protein
MCGAACFSKQVEHVPQVLIDLGISSALLQSGSQSMKKAIFNFRHHLLNVSQALQKVSGRGNLLNGVPLSRRDFCSY